MSKPLSDLTKKDCTWNWGVEQQNAFEALKKAFTMAPVLRIPNDEDPFKLSTDTSDFATGAVLLQKDMQTNCKGTTLRTLRLLGRVRIS